MHVLRQQYNRFIRAAPGSSNATIGLTALNDHRASVLSVADRSHRRPMKRTSSISEAMQQLAGRLSWHRLLNPQFIGLFIA